MPIEQFIIEFSTDTTQLEKGQGKVSDSLKKVNTELAKQQQALGREVSTISKLTQSLDTLSGESKEAVASLLKLGGKEVVAGFDKLGVSVDDYIHSLQGAEKETKKFATTSSTAKGRLREMTNELIRMADAGDVTSKEFLQLQKEAGALKDQIGDVRDQIRIAGSDTRVFDGMLNAVQGLAGGFAVVQGAQALFGDESKELQETLLKVNAAMAMLQGLQQIQQVLQKESAAAQLLMRLRLNALSAAQAAYTAVVGTSTGALKVFRIALASTGVGLLVVGLVALIQNFDKVKETLGRLLPDFGKFATTIKGLVQDFTDWVGITSQTDRNIDRVTKGVEKVNRGLERQIKVLESQEGKESEIFAAKMKRLDNEQLLLETKVANGIKLNEEEFKALQDIQDDRAVLVNENNKRIADINQAAHEKRLADEKKQEEELKQQKVAFFNDEIARLQLAQIGVGENTMEWKNLEAAIIATKLQLDLLSKKGNEAKLAMEIAARETAALFVSLRPSVSDAVKSDTDIATQFMEDAAKEQIEIDKRATEEKHKNINDLLNAQLRANDEIEKDQKEKTEKEREAARTRVELAMQTASQITGIFAEAFKQQTDRELQAIEGQKDRVKELEELGAISAKEAEKRMAQLDAKEKDIKLKAAKRDKAIALFQATIDTAQAVVKAYSTTGPIAGAVLAAIVGAIGAAQIALIAARPIPKFSKGKKDSYAGLGIVGEAGAELIERNGRMEITTRPTLTHLNARDRVFTPQETAKMLESLPSMSRRPIEIKGQENGLKIDYDRIGKSIAKHLPENHIDINETGIHLMVKRGFEKIKYLDKRRKF